MPVVRYGVIITDPFVGAVDACVYREERRRFRIELPLGLERGRGKFFC